MLRCATTKSCLVTSRVFLFSFFGVVCGFVCALMYLKRRTFLVLLSLRLKKANFWQNWKKYLQYGSICCICHHILKDLYLWPCSYMFCIDIEGSRNKRNGLKCNILIWKVKKAIEAKEQQKWAGYDSLPKLIALQGNRSG